MPAFLTKYIVILLIAASGLALGLWSRLDSAVKHRANEAIKSRTAEPSVVATHYQPHACSPSVSNRNSGFGGSDDTGRNGSNTCDGYAVDGTGTRPHSVSTVGGTTPPASESFVDMLPAVAKPLQMAELSTPTDGVLWKLSIREGDEVEADTLLALIDNRQTLAAYKVAEAGADRKAGLSVAAAKLSLAEQYLKRIENAHSQNAASGLEMDEAKSRVQEARAALEEGHELHREALARLEMEQTRLSSHELRAPFAGTVTRIKKNVGETLTPRYRADDLGGPESFAI
ncbi:MAG: biotin/lipoyl-binding protein [Pirellulales bacterium]